MYMVKRRAKIKKDTLFTIGHSTRTITEFVNLLKAHNVKQIVDVRTIPKSRHNPQFNEGVIEKSLRKEGIDYIHLSELGGLRHTTKDSINTGWRNKSFRGYADYMATDEFEEGLKILQKLGKDKSSAIMCAEALPWRCHRSMIADALTKKHWNVFDIMSLKTASKHHLTPFLKIRKGKITYPEIRDARLPIQKG